VQKQKMREREREPKKQILARKTGKQYAKYHSQRLNTQNNSRHPKNTQHANIQTFHQAQKPIKHINGDEQKRNVEKRKRKKSTAE
jgi:ribose 1,5-bisphosphokinase PhnN